MILLFFALFLIFSGTITLEIVIFGLLLSTAMTLFCAKFLDYHIRQDLIALRLVPQVIAYFFVLVVEILKANCAVIPLIISPKYEIEPALITFHTSLKSELAKTILANSITLTPGTITVELIEEEFQVHCLDKEFSKGITESVFVRRLEKMEQTVTKMKIRGGKKK